MIWKDIDDCSVQDLEHLIKTYQSNKGAIKRISLDIEAKEVELNPSAGSVIVISKDKHDNTDAINQRRVQLFFEIDQLQAERAPYERKVAVVDELLKRIEKDGTQEEYEIIEARRDGLNIYELTKQFSYNKTSIYRRMDEIIAAAITKKK